MGETGEVLTHYFSQARRAEKGQGTSLLRTQEGGTQVARRREEEREYRRQDAAAAGPVRIQDVPLVRLHAGNGAEDGFGCYCHDTFLGVE